MTDCIALFNYGGGMRGLVPAHFMTRLEDKTGLRMADMVDIFAGPSTGAILNASLNVPSADQPTVPRFRARHMVRFYEREGSRIFPADQFRELRGIIHDFNHRTLKLNQLNALVRYGNYNPAHLGRACKALFGETKLNQSLRSLIIPCYNIDGGQLELVTEKGETGDSPVHTQNNVTDRGGHAIWLKNIRTGHPADSQTPDVALYDAVMASCAAPTYFPCHHFRIRWPESPSDHYISAIDGNIFDNPCISYLGAIRNHVPPDRRLIMLVLGTGYTNRSFRKEEWNRFGALGVVDPVNDLPLINIFFHASETALTNVFAQEMGDNLFVFNKPMVDPGKSELPSTQIDDASPENLRRLRMFFEEMMEENAARFDDLCHILVNRRDSRQREQESMARQVSKYFTFFRGLRGMDKTAIDDHEKSCR